ncbi:MAG: helix-turn-helix domain-containing protein [Planctomycetota bacterium]|nr:helix-turn-helix domain-containing protein [Planctomycetota bacterium]
MEYREVTPEPPLDRFVKCFWTLRAERAGDERIVPDGRGELIISVGDPVRDLETDRWQPDVMLAGQLTGAMRIAPGGAVDLVGVRFRPAGMRSFFGAPMRELTDRRVAVDDVDRRLGRELRGASVARAHRVLLDRLRPARGDAEAAVAAIGATHGLATIDTITARTGIHPRRLERLFRDEVGLTPKQLARIARFQRVFRMVESTERLDWAGAALACGYADQSHLIREFRRLAGLTPDRYFKTEHPLADLLTGVSDSSNPAA